jgi:hypothetical protein
LWQDAARHIPSLLWENKNTGGGACATWFSLGESDVENEVVRVTQFSLDDGFMVNKIE